MRSRARKHIAILLAVALAALMGCSPRPAPVEESSSQPASSAPPRLSSSSIAESDAESQEASLEEILTSIAEESEAQPESSAASKPESSAEEASQEEAEGLTPFNYKLSQVTTIYARNATDFTYAPLGQIVMEQTVALLQKALTAKPQEIYSATQGGLMVVMNDADRTRFNFTLIPTAVRVGDDAYPMSDEDYNALKAIVDYANTNGLSYIQWLIYMNPARVASITYQPSTASPLQVEAQHLPAAIQLLTSIQVKKGMGKTYDIGAKFFDPADDRIVIQIQFDSDIVYKIGIQQGVFYIESSDMNYGIEYRLVTSEADIRSNMDFYCVP